MKSFYRTLLLAGGAALLAAGCASGPQYKDVASSIPTLSPDDGRIYFFRSDSFAGAMLQPEIKLNDKVVGHSKAGGFFYVDEPAGSYTVATSTEVTRTVTFDLKAGETKYVRTAVSMGVLVGHITPTIDYPENAQSEIQTLKYIGDAAPAVAQGAQTSATATTSTSTGKM